MHYDVVISGAGMVGATLACLLAKAGKQVAVLEACPPPMFNAEDDFELRVSALSRFSQRILEKSGAWGGVIKRRATAYEDMVVWDATGTGEIHFSAAELGEPELGHIVENKVIQLALLEAMNKEPSIDLFCPSKIHSFERNAAQVSVILDDGRELTAELLVGADGARSAVRELAGIDWQQEDYAQKGLVCVVRTQLPHQETAWQRFMPSGPLAFLPLSDPHCSSIVWTLPADRADVLLSQDKTQFKMALADALGFRLGEIEAAGPRGAFPLVGSHATHYVQEGVALIGDAAHTIHPLAGQGVNLGIKDAAELSDQLIAAKGGNLGGMRTLRCYERARKGDNHLTQKSMEGFRLLFGNTSQPLRLVRNSGLSLADNLPLIKNILAHQAMGV
uniref:2-octaprenyl-3-methyl-6-methoxy-1,4-benzoquinol hydroxylase (EC) n=1 Tax=uncultured Thiotrichaceae bacterium TaxID=298394 RepID=A0A6S6SF68_9GAMM|nr:MAG: 2-octaprenyl-3-methyl-6-methoxy-1,4-benzoquinol hydroxylase (EC [uncultured Thiotrichaceae bacterium]